MKEPRMQFMDEFPKGIHTEVWNNQLRAFVEESPKKNSGSNPLMEYLEKTLAEIPEVFISKDGVAGRIPTLLETFNGELSTQTF